MRSLPCLFVSVLYITLIQNTWCWLGVCLFVDRSTTISHNVQTRKLEAQKGQKSLTWIRLIMICYTVPWWLSWLSDHQTTSKAPILELNDLAILNLHVTPIPPIKFRLNLTYCLGQRWLKDFQDGCHGGHLGYQNRTILAILNLHAAPMLSTKFPLHPTYGSGGNNNWKLSRWLPWGPSLFVLRFYGPVNQMGSCPVCQFT